MRKFFLIALFFVAACGLSGQSANLFSNSSFRELNSSSLPLSWGISISGERKVISGEEFNILQLSSLLRNSRYKVSISQKLSSLPAGKYVISGDIRGNVDILNIVLLFNENKALAPILQQISGGKMGNLADGWRSFSSFLQVPQNEAGGIVVFEPFTQQEEDRVELARLSLCAVAEDEAITPQAEASISSGLLVDASAVVCNPSLASQVKWEMAQYSGKDYWQLLTTNWLSMDGVSEEAFVQNSGHVMRMFYSNQGEVRGDLRKTKIKELELFRGGKNTAPEAVLEFTADEEDALFYALEKVQDGDLSSSGFVIGDTTDFRRRNNGLAFEILVRQKATIPLEKIRISTEERGSAPLAQVEIVDLSGKVLSVSYNRKNSDQIWEMTLVEPFAADSFIIRCKTLQSFYQFRGVPAKFKERFKKVPFVDRFFYFGQLHASLKKNNVDRASIAKVHNEFPDTFLGQTVDEVEANFFQKRNNPMRFRDQLVEQAYIVPVYDRTVEEGEASLRANWKRYIDFFGELNALSGGMTAAQYFYEWGVPMVMAGSLNEAPWSNNRTIFNRTRSGARQYGKPWASYLTSYALGASAASRLTEEEALKLVTPENPWSDGLDFGLAPSAFKRCQYIAYYSGASFQLFETDPTGMAVQDKVSKRWSLTQNGEAAKDVYEWSCKPEGQRGSLYAPILFLADYYHGNWEWKHGEHWKVWYLQPYQDADYMFHHATRAFDPFLGHDYGKDYTLMKEKGWSLVNSKLGDIYDLYFANPPSGIVSIEEMLRYPLAMLLGDVRFSEELLANMRAYVEKGGTLVLNAAQHESFLSDPKFIGAELSEDWKTIGEMKVRELKKVSGEVLASVSSTPLVIKNRYGKGQVVFMTPYFLLDMKNKKQPLPLLGEFLEKIQSEVCPVQVSGNIHFLFNKMDGNNWKLVLFNHRGVYKHPMRTKEHFHPEYAAEVSIDGPPGTKARELRLQAGMRQEGNRFTLTVPAGEIAVVDLEVPGFSTPPLVGMEITRKGGFFKEYNVNQGLLLKSDFDGKPGDIAVDGSGRDNHGKFIDGLKASDGLLHFNADGAYAVYHLKVPKTPVHEGMLECWARPDSSLAEKKQMVITNEWVKVGFDKGRWYASFYDLAKSDSITGPEVEFDQWTHLVFTWNDKLAQFYVNGKEVTRGSGPLFHVNALDGPNDHSVKLYLGTHHHIRADLFKGQIDAVRYYGHYFDKEAVAENFQQWVSQKKQ